MLKQIATRAAVAASVAASAGALMFGAATTASAAEATPQGDLGTMAVCGYYEQGLISYYNHCGSTNITIHVTYNVGSDEDLCVTPGITKLGYNADNAWYTGLC
ncbi:DUF6355 family natural product biosynthesis protein [Amycolatopsis decaplanina]|uniref:Secreted protein n=1 Tax=Amycolatopsis decaplanina DSM 44594 TaxID=1284240 RepID=M2ZL37_9PSEU|nr:DUF6355 family natural product biosynthesis protein [Amycolatopsis decaplanina]EME61603.1 hypothetical protein H074_10540 [Amycolatopsis decaplanina DSM 44594]